jgi:ankyrin repeat protein
MNIKMNTIIKISFQNSQFYRNCNNIDFIISKFQKIRNEYTVTKNKYKNRLENDFLEKKIHILYDSLYNKNNINVTKLYSTMKILDEKIKLSKNIKNYVKYSNDINNDFIKSVKIGYIKNIYILLKNGANIHVNNDYALRFSSENGNFEVVKFLIGNGANIHADNDYALKISSHNGHFDVVKFLIKNGANIHADNNFALRWSSSNGYIKVVKFLIENGAYIHAYNDYALILSCQNGHTEIVKFLVEKGSDVHSQNDRALKCSASFGHDEIVKILIENDANIHVDDDYVFKEYISQGNISMVKYLVEKGANIQNAYEYINDFILINSVKVIKYLIKFDIDKFSNNSFAESIINTYDLHNFYNNLISK